MDFKDKCVVITGGATGIGLSLAKKFGSDGANIILFEPREAVLKEALSTLQSLGIEAQYKAGDVTNADDVETLAKFAWAQYGRCDVLINNAGIGGTRDTIFDMDMSDARALYDVNFFGVWHGIKSFGRRMRDDGLPSAIYSVASENALFNALPKGGSAYVSSKHAVHGLMEVFRRDAPDNIHCGVIMPGWVSTDLSGHKGMDVDAFANIIYPQICDNQYYVISHAYNKVRITERYDEICQSLDNYAPRYDRDDEYDVQLYVERLKRDK